MNKFDLIYTDPPWNFRTWSKKGQGRSPKYPVMRMRDIVDLGDLIRPITAENAVLFMWVTSPILDRAFEVIKSWGFTYKTKAFCWVKQNRRQASLFMGLGYYTRANTEDCLLAVKGKMPVIPSCRPPQVMMSPRREHSRKPDETYARMARMYPGTRRLEVFASANSMIRARQHHFLPLGFDIDGLDIRDALRRLVDEKD